MQDNHACSEPWYSQNILLKHFLGYLNIFRDIDVYLAALIGTQLRWKRKASPILFENRKTCPYFLKKGHDNVHLCI